MTILTDNITERLRYTASFIAKELGMDAPVFVTVGSEQRSDIVLQYTHERQHVSAYWVKPAGLLSETGVKKQHIKCFESNGTKAFFRSAGEHHFDIFSAVFYLISRYEEYLPHDKDAWGRYHHANSIAFIEGFLNVPLVNIWIQQLKTSMGLQSTRAVQQFTFLPTYDIDIAWSVKEKGFWRNAAGALKETVSLQFRTLSSRLRVLFGKSKDPYDAYGWMNALHQRYDLRPYYFFLIAERTGKYDKNISPESPALRALISDHLIRYPVGIHPSWRSGDDERLLKNEIATLKDITGTDVLSSRQHYIRVQLPDTYRQLLAAGIRFDFSMGYGSINGFRASVASPYFWYDLEREQSTGLMLFPFCYMEANSFHEQKYTAAQALEEMRWYHLQVKAINGMLITIWHNHTLGKEKLYEGWREMYEQFIASVKP